MFRKLLWVAVMSLVVGVQALAVDCDLRCASMGISTESHASHASMQMLHCRGMSMGQDKQNSMNSIGCCATGGCGAQLKPIAKSPSQNDAGSSKLLVLAVIRFIDPHGNSGSDISTAAPLSRTSDSRPLAQRPGSPLRI
jgi:hypothetical protein